MIIVYVVRWNSDDGGLHELPIAQETEDHPNAYSLEMWYDTEDEAAEDIINWHNHGGRVDGPVLILKQVLL